jgi:hypothetical protein
MKVFIIVEECHGSIGVAISPKSAMRWLIAEGWIDEYSQYSIWDEAKREWHHAYVYEVCEQNGIADWQRWLIDNASAEFLEDHFLIYLREHDLAVAE